MDYWGGLQRGNRVPWVGAKSKALFKALREGFPMANSSQWQGGYNWGKQNPSQPPPPKAPQDWANGARTGQGKGK